MKIYRVPQALRRTSQHWARFLPQGWHGPPSHQPHFTHRPQVYLRRWRAGKAVRVSEPCRQFISLRHILSSCHKGHIFWGHQRQKVSEPEWAQGCFFTTNKRKLCTERSPTLSSATLLPGDRRAGSWCVNKCSLVSMEGKDQVLGSTHRVAGKALLNCLRCVPPNWHPWCFTGNTRPFIMYPKKRVHFLM